ncbi:MAG: purine-nucleoside phosphorylase [Nitrospinota bacterium]|nr:purine-nucleoside phosphorylase [Nitrospinota bacterium]
MSELTNLMPDTEDDNKENTLDTSEPQETEAKKTGAKRKSRTAKRAPARPATLRRRKVETPAPAQSASAESTPTPEPAPTRSPRRAKKAVPARAPMSRKSTSKTPVSKTPVSRKPVSRSREKAGDSDKRPARGPIGKTERWDEDKYEIKSLPDGTQLKVKLTDDRSPKKRLAPRAIRGGEGPGPAMVDLDEYNSPFTAGERTINLGSLVTKNRRAVTYLKRHLEVRPKVAVILGSGLYPVAELAEGKPIEFSKIPGFKQTSAQGHPGRVRVGMVGGTPTLFCEGRLHYYETMSMADVVLPLRVFMSLGVEYLILTTSAGGLNPKYRAGDVMFVRDHINLMGDNPFFGENPNSDPSPFVDLSAVYDEKMITQSERICRRIRVIRHEGVLAGMRGPVYETSAERNWLRSIGADAVCMSVIPEALAAAGVGVPVTALALIANDAASMKNRVLTHEAVAQAGEKYAANVGKLVHGILGSR